jgi:hypothetical protein
MPDNNTEGQAFLPPDQQIKKNQEDASRYISEQGFNQLQETPNQPESIPSAVVRGAAPTAITAGLGAIAGLPAGMPLQGAKIAAGIPAYGDMMVNSLNSVLKTHYTTPSDAITHLLDKAGVPEPRTYAEQIAYQFSRGGSEAAGAATSAGMAGEAAYLANSPIAKGVMAALGKNPIEQAAAGSALQGGAEAVKQAGGNVPAQLLIPAAGLAGVSGLKAMIPAGQKALEGIVPATIQAIRGNQPAVKALAQAAAPAPQLQEAAKALGLTGLPSEFLTQNKPYQAMVQTIKSMPSSQIAREQESALQDVGSRAKQLIEDLGGTTDLSQLSSDVKDKMLKTAEDLKGQSEVLHKEVDAKVPPSTQVYPDQTLSFLEQRLKERQGRIDQLTPFERDLIKAIKIQKDGTMPSRAILNDWRKEIGRATNVQGYFGREDEGLAKKYYSLLSEDDYQNLENLGHKDLAQQARETSRTQKELEGNIENLFDQEVTKSLSGTLRGGITALSKGDEDKFVNIMNALPEDLRQKVAISGVSHAFGQATQNGSLNFNTYSKWYEGLKNTNKKAYQTLVDNLPAGAADHLDNLYKVSKNIDNALKKEVRTGLISSSAFKDVPESMATKVWDAAKTAMIGAGAGSLVSSAFGQHGLGYELASAVAGAGTRAFQANKRDMFADADRFLTSPEFRKLVSASQANPELFNQTAQQVEKSSAFKKYADAVGIPLAQRAGFFANMAMDQGQGQQKQTTAP